MTHPDGRSTGGNALELLEAGLARASAASPLVRVSGRITEISHQHFRVSGLSQFVRLGEPIIIDSPVGPTFGEVIKIDQALVTVKPFESHCGAVIGARAYRADNLFLFPHPDWKGRVFDALGRPLDGRSPPLSGDRPMPFDREPPAPLQRARVTTPIRTGIRVIDFFTPLCAGQRMGIFAGSGVGKSSLLAMLANAPSFDTVVIGLVGERGREVREFLDDTLGEKRHSVIAVVSTGDESPMMRRLAPKTAMAIAEYFRDAGESVLLIIDSVTRFAHAAREVAIASGEPAVARGYAPSVFSDLPRLLERAGPGVEGSGSITGFFSVLVDGDDHNDPVADSIRGTLDGHIVLDRGIAEQGRYPAVNILASISRLSQMCWTPEQKSLVLKLRALVSRFEDTRDLRLMGGYTPGSDPTLDQAVRAVPRIYEAMTQMLDSAPSQDPFIELAAALRAEQRPVESESLPSTSH